MPHVERKGIRDYPPLPDTCELTLAPFDSSSPRAALLHDQSQHGGSILCVMDNPPKNGDTVIIKSNSESVEVLITYVLQVGHEVHHIGFQFIESTPL